MGDTEVGVVTRKGALDQARFVLGASAEARRTSRTENLVSLPAVTIDGASFVATVPAQSITTFVVSMP